MANSRKTTAKKVAKKVASLEVAPQVNNTSLETAEIKIRKIDKARDFLARNKVFFETIAATTLTIMAIVLAWSQLKVAEEQTNYLEQQTTIERAQAMPQIVIVQEGIEGTANKVSKEKIFIYNQGNIARHVDVFSRCLLEIHTYDGVGISIPIADYYGAPKFTQNSTGLLATIDNEKMFPKVSEIESEIRQLAENDVISTFTISRNIMVYYQDIFGGTHREFFYINPVFGAQLLDDGDSLEKEYFDGLRWTPDFTSLTVEEILNLLTNQ